MIYYVKGKIKDRMPGAVAIENNGVAFLVNVPDNSTAFLAKENDEITLYTSMIVREDDISLYGFTNKESLALFKLLQTVSGIGAKAALSILSIGSVDAINNAIANEDIACIQTANGIGKKTAQRVILELKDKVKTITEIVHNTPIDNSAKKAAIDALMALGYSKQEASAALVGIDADTTEEYIAKALRNK
ncbi:MAG: Holliday junction branch migration protein RuvA [Bacillota bacterium]|nr:Holliday junction branch migration protein RuvA [Bacillota bacterium]